MFKGEKNKKQFSWEKDQNHEVKARLHISDFCL